MAKFTPTKAQQSVLDNTSRNLLVSASAGSGKTATIIQKISNLISKQNVDIHKLLVITFTEASSLEMKIRLKEKLFEEAKDNLNLSKQIDKLPTSDICTIHSFCAKNIRKYFFELEINPNFAVLDNNNSNFLKATAINKVIENYSAIKDNDFVTLSQILGGGRNFVSLKNNVLSLYEFLCSIEDRENYIKNKALLCYEEDLTKNKSCEILNNYLLSNIYYIQMSLNEFLLQAQNQNCSYFIDFIKTMLAVISGVNYKYNFIKNREQILNITFPTLTRKKLSDEDSGFKDEFKPFFDDAKKILAELKKIIIDKPIEELSANLIKTKNIITKFLEVEENFENEYEKLKQKRNTLDFNDLEKYFLKLLNNEEVRNNISNNYSYIFVDEYQDINNKQELILNKLTNNNNMIMVGDVKQSIYGFRNSSPTIFVNKSINFSSNSSDGSLINLNENFRSNPVILNFVNAIFNKCMSQEFGGVDYINNGQLCGMTEYSKVNDLPIVSLNIINTKKEEDDEEESSLTENYSYPYSVLSDSNEYASKLTTARKEAMLVANQILNLIGKNYYDAKNKETKKIAFSDIAILSRGNDFLKQVANVLLEYKIPLTLNVSDNIYKDNDVATLLSILKIINNFHDDVSLSSCLVSFIGNFTFDELATIRNKYSTCEFFYESVKSYLENENNEIKIKLQKFMSIIYELREKLVYCSIYDLLNFLQAEYDFLSYYKSLPNGETRYSTLKNFINSFEGAEYNYNLNKYLDFVENFAKDTENQMPIPASPNSVKMGTIHSSKGLEYPIVFLVGIGKTFSNTTFKSEVLKDKDYGLGVNCYDMNKNEKSLTLARNAITINLKKQEKAEELRLLYVALTRAKNNLIIIGSKNINKLQRIKTFKDAQVVNSFAEWVLSGLSDVSFNCLKQNKENFIDKQTNFEVMVNVYSDNYFDIKHEKQIELNLKSESNFEVEKLLNNFNYTFESHSNLALKNTVSSMLQEHAEDGSSLNFEPKKLEVSENKLEGIDASKLGTIYHNIMQKIDFKDNVASSLGNIEKIINDLAIEKKYQEKVSSKKISICIKKIQTLNIINTLKEQPFLSYLPYNKIFKSSITHKILIQGVADLIVQTNDGYILIDYKTTRAKVIEQLVAKYDVQLKLYKLCLEKAMNIKIKRVLIYSFYFDDFVEIF